MVSSPTDPPSTRTTHLEGSSTISSMTKLSDPCQGDPCHHYGPQSSDRLADRRESIESPESWYELWRCFLHPAENKPKYSSEEWQRFETRFQRCQRIETEDQEFEAVLLKRLQPYQAEYDVPESTPGLHWDSTDEDKAEMQELIKMNEARAAKPVTVEEYLVQFKDFSDDELKVLGIAREEIFGAIENLAIIEKAQERARKQSTLV
jgi:hypothetical protein